MKPTIRRAADVLLSGGVIAYPTEGVFGLGCMADDESAMARIIGIKHRDATKGLILIVAAADQLDGWIADADRARIPQPDPCAPVTWIVTPKPGVSPLVRGEHKGVAVRITGNPVARQICEAVDAPIVSTSANISGRPVARNPYVLRRQFAGLVDYIVPGRCGPASGPSEIRSLSNQEIVRSRTK